MLKVLRAGAPGFDPPAPTGPDWTLPADTVWIDLHEPTRDEELAVERVLGLQLPTREEMLEIEPSSRIYQDGPSTFMTALVLYNTTSERPSAEPITFVLTNERLVTIRYVDPKAFSLFVSQAARQATLCPTAAQTFLGLIEAVVDRTADVVERVAAEIEDVSRAVFADRHPDKYRDVLARLGRSQSVVAKVRDSLVSLSRLASFASLADTIEHSPENNERLKSIARDVRSLLDHDTYLSSNISFLLDTSLGLINIEQNAIIKIFSVAAVAFLPPTLIASIYGMNFVHMPELEWRLGYPFAVTLMVLSAIVPLLWFRKKGWL
ncbi:MAG TPA: magnesium transporter CorA family protein [Caulobacteraceae bacterium]|jgi:magnesium transporter